MPKRPFLFTITLVAIVSFKSCRNDPMPMVPFISGYWEIEKVIAKDGTERDYGINLVVDYFSLDGDLKGYRKKLTPNLDGSFSTSDHKEDISLSINGNKLIINYKTPYDNWEETVVDANKETLILKNEQGVTYIYKPYEILKLDE